MKSYQIMVAVFGVEPYTVFMINKLRSKNLTITALWDKQLSKAAEISKEHSIPYHSDDYNEIIMRKDVDLVIVLSASHFAIPIATRAVSIGKHVICNNCAGIDRQDMTRMVEAGLYYPQLLSMPFNPLRFNEAYCSLKDHMEDIGKLSYIRVTMNCQAFSNSAVDSRYNWRCETFMGGGVLNIYGSNIIDIVGFITNENSPVRAWGSLLRQEGIHCDSMASFELILGDNVHVFVTIAAFLESKRHSIEFLVSGSHGYLVIRDHSLFRNLYGDGREVSLVTSGQSSCQFETDVDGCYAEFKIGFSNLINSLHGMFIYNEEQKKMTYQSTNKLANFHNMGITAAVLNAIRLADKTKCIQYVDY